MKPLQGITVLITRDATQAGGLKSRLVEEGAEVVVVPTIAIGDPPEWSSFDKAAAELERFSWVVFGSVNAVTRTHDRLTTLGIDLNEFSTIKIAAVGDQTARQIEALGWKTDLVPDRFQAEDLAQKLVSTGLEGKRIWLPRALVARNVMIEQFTDAGAEIVVTPVYQNRIPLENRELLQKALDEQQIDWITFTSGSTVTNFVKILDRDLEQATLPKLASIGEITTQTIQSYHLQPAFTASPQNLAGLCRGIVDYEACH